MSFSERVRRSLVLSPRHVRVGDASAGGTIAIDLRPQSVQEAEEHHARRIAALQQQHQAALEVAYRNGYSDGAAMARDTAAAELEQSARFVETLLAELVRTRSEWFETYERQMVELVCRALEQILGGRPPTAEPVSKALRDAFTRLGDGDRVTVRCHPEDLKLIRERAECSSEEFVGSRQVKWVADPDLRPGGCLVETTLGVVDARVEQQLAVLRGALWDALPQVSANATGSAVSESQISEDQDVSFADSPGT